MIKQYKNNNNKIMKNLNTTINQVIKILKTNQNKIVRVMLQLIKNKLAIVINLAIINQTMYPNNYHNSKIIARNNKVSNNYNR